MIVLSREPGGLSLYQQLYRQLGQHLKAFPGWRQYIITSEPEFEHYFGRRADKKRKLYNGMIKCDLYQYL